MLERRRPSIILARLNKVVCHLVVAACLALVAGQLCRSVTALVNNEESIVLSTATRPLGLSDVPQMTFCLPDPQKNMARRYFGDPRLLKSMDLFSDLRWVDEILSKLCAFGAGGASVKMNILLSCKNT